MLLFPLPEAVYFVAGACCAQLLLMRQTFSDSRYHFSKIPSCVDNESAIKLANNRVRHSGTKHIDIRHNLLRDHKARRDTIIRDVSTDKQLGDIFTKPLDESRICVSRSKLNIIDSCSIA